MNEMNRHLKAIEKHLSQTLGFDADIYIVSTENAPLDLTPFENNDSSQIKKQNDNIFDAKIINII